MSSNNFFYESERDTRRAFTQTQKKELLYQQDNKCAECHEKLDPRDIEYDHMKPWAFGGRTKTVNGRALCGSCHNKVTHGTRLKNIDDNRKTNSDYANKPSSNIKAVKDIFDQFNKTRKTNVSENTKAAKQEKPISKRELLNRLSRTKLIKIAEKLNVCSEMERFVYEKEGYVDILSSSRKVTVEKIKEILGT